MKFDETMNSEELKNKLQELETDREFVEKLQSCKTLEEASELFGSEGLEITPEKLQEIGEIAIRQENGELTDEDLEKVNGGLGELLTCLFCGYFLIKGIKKLILHE